MKRNRRPSAPTLLLLQNLLSQPRSWQYGYELSLGTGLKSGTLYPILMRLEKLRWLETRWEDVRTAGRPPRHLYRLSGTAREWAREELRAAEQRHFWKPAEEQA